MDPALTTHGLTRRFGATLAVDALSMTVPAQAIYGFLGSNGAGKTTALRLVLGLLRANGGTIRLFGAAADARNRTQVGALIETPPSYDHLTGRENLEITRMLRSVARSEIERVFEIVDLSFAADRRVSGYSLGMRQRLGIARALIGNPRLLILDEPTNGLDPDGIRDMRTLLRRLRESGDVTLLVSSHLLSEVEQIATHVGLIHQGRLLAEAPLNELLGNAGTIEIETRDSAAARAILSCAGFTVEPSQRDAQLLVRTASDGRGADPAEVAALLVRENQELVHLAAHRRSLETIYHQLLAEAA